MFLVGLAVSELHRPACYRLPRLGTATTEDRSEHFGIWNDDPLTAYQEADPIQHRYVLVPPATASPQPTFPHSLPESPHRFPRQKSRQMIDLDFDPIASDEVTGLD